MSKKLKVGIIGLGSMGSTHLDIYSKIKDVEVIAIADSIQSRLDGSSKAEGNISGQAEGGVTDLSVKKYLDGMDLINNSDIDIVDICVAQIFILFLLRQRLPKINMYWLKSL
tara:strand:- start:160 stop:495 length:336 start_codon:yes stop_codon:yes gene_type:complete